MDWDSEEFRAEREKRLFEWFKGDWAAVNCFGMISQIAETWDDLIDDDVASDDDINQAFAFASFGLLQNSFFQQHQQAIVAMEIVIANAWLDANELVKTEGKDARIQAYVLRNVGLELVPMFAFFKGGYSHMRKVSKEMREFFTHETFDEWERGL